MDKSTYQTLRKAYLQAYQEEIQSDWQTVSKKAHALSGEAYIVRRANPDDDEDTPDLIYLVRRPGIALKFKTGQCWIYWLGRHANEPHTYEFPLGGHAYWVEVPESARDEPHDRPIGLLGLLWADEFRTQVIEHIGHDPNIIAIED